MNVVNDLVLFYEKKLRNKADVIAYLKKIIEYYDSAEEDELIQSDIKKEAMIDVLERMLDKVETSFIPTLEDSLNFYKVKFENDGVQLEKVWVAKYDIDYDCEEPDICFEQYRMREKVIKVNCDYISVKEYGRMCEVSENTVRNWIRRGKLRIVKKEGRDWLIPSLYEKPGRGFKAVAYSWGEISKEIQEEFTFLPDKGGVELQRGAFGDGDFRIFVYDYYGEIIDTRALSSKERERFELKMIAAPEIKVQVFDCLIGVEFFKDVLDVPWLSRRGVIFEENELMLIWSQYHEKRIDSFANDLFPGDSLTINEYRDYMRPFKVEFLGGFVEDTMEADVETICDYGEELSVASFSGMLFLKDITKEYVEGFFYHDEMVEKIERDLMIWLGLEKTQRYELLSILRNVEDVLLIDELKIDDEVLDIFHKKGELMEERMFDRILREIPSVVKKKLSVKPHVLVHSLKNYSSEEERQKAEKRYAVNGFTRLGNTDLMYTYC